MKNVVNFFRTDFLTARVALTVLKPGRSMLTINNFTIKLLSKLLRDLSNRVHLESISKFTNKVINGQYFCKWTCF